MKHSDACLACTNDFRLEIEGPKDSEALTGPQQKEDIVESRFGTQFAEPARGSHGRNEKEHEIGKDPRTDDYNEDREVSKQGGSQASAH